MNYQPIIIIQIISKNGNINKKSAFYWTKAQLYLHCPFKFFYVLVVFDMFTAVAETAALTAVSKLHLRMRQIGDAAGCAAMEGVFLA